MIKLNGFPIDVTHFPDNTSQVWKLPEELLAESNRFHISWRFSHEGEIMHLAQLAHLLHSVSHAEIHLSIKYLPYGRQDKNVSNSATFALRTFGQFLATMGFDSISILDPHSDVVFGYLQNAWATYPTDKVRKAMDETESNLLCYPDKGAHEKYSKIYEFPFVYGNKTRDQSTGNITGYELVGDVAGKNVLIVDDICDGGATFKILTKDLLANGAKSVALFVTHGIFSKGVRTLIDAGIARVFTADGEVTARHNSQNI